MHAAPLISFFGQRKTKPLNQIQRHEQSEVSPEKDLPSRDFSAHPDIVIGRERDPCNRKAEYGATKRENAGSFGRARTAKRSIVHVFCTEACNDAKQNDHNDPADSFIVMDEFIAKERDNERNEGDEDDADNEGNLIVGKSRNNLSAHYRVDH